MDKTIFVRGYLRDAFTKTDEDGTLTAKRNKRGSERAMDKFLKKWNLSRATWHGECVLDLFTVKAVALRHNAPEWAVEIAHDIATALGVPVEVVRPA